MMEQLGIKKLRPGPSGQQGATNSANYDPAKANPYPNLPDPLTLKNGQKVTQKWPKNGPKNFWTVFWRDFGPFLSKDGRSLKSSKMPSFQTTLYIVSDSQLGGRDFDEAIFTHVLDQLKRKYPKFNWTQKHYNYIRNACVKDKEALSSKDSTT